MTMKETANGPEWVMWLVLAIFVILTIVLLSGKGANLIAGYNDLSKEEKEKYNEKRLSRVCGAGFGLITILIFILTVFGDVISATFCYVFLAIVLIDIAVMLILFATYCKNK